MKAILNGARQKDLEKLSPSMWNMLFDARDHANPFHSIYGKSASGGASGTYYALKRKGLLSLHGEITPAGREACNVEWS